ncbi:MAG: hypothetical protein ABH867_00245, partial [Patescibacteria group bacterium]
RQKISPLTQRNIPYANVKLEVVPPEIEICLDREKELILTIDPVADNAEGPISFAAAELSFSFDPKKIQISSIEFHQEYAGSLWNKEAANQSGQLRITILSLSQNLPQEKFELSKIAVVGEKTGESELALEPESSRLMGVRGSTDPTLSHELKLNHPETVKTLIKVAKCEG